MALGAAAGAKRSSFWAPFLTTDKLKLQFDRMLVGLFDDRMEGNVRFVGIKLGEQPGTCCIRCEHYKLPMHRRAKQLLQFLASVKALDDSVYRQSIVL